jgi:hypothetical protein
LPLSGPAAGASLRAGCLLSLPPAGGDYWLGRWAAAVDQRSPYWLGVYGGLVALVVVAACLRSGLFFIHSLK